jgi:dTDP-4-dehydrorhamnose 3,5-epimerase
MNIYDTDFVGVKIIEPKVFVDERGYFCETFKESEFEEKVCKTKFIQDNEAKSTYGVLRGLHYQLPPFAQAKLVRVISGRVMDVIVDLRKSSSTFGKQFKIELSEDNKKQIFIPRGFAHGYIVLSEEAILCYKVDNNYSPKHESSILYNDDLLDIDWLVSKDKILLSDKDL